MFARIVSSRSRRDAVRHPLRLAALAAVLVCSSFESSARAEDLLPSPVRLDQVLALARSRSPEIVAARESARAAALMPPQVEALDDPVLRFESWNAPGARLDRADDEIFTLTQRFPFPGKKSAAARAAASDAGIADASAHATELEVARSAARAFHRVRQADAALRVRQRERNLLARIADAAERRYAVAETPQMEAARARLELARAGARVAAAELERDAARAELNARLARAPQDPVGNAEAPPEVRLDAPDARWIEHAIDHRPEIAAEARAIDRSQARLHAAELDRLPDFEIAVSRFVDPGRRDGLGIMASLSLPFIHPARYDAEIDEARARASASAAAARAARISIVREVTQALAEARSARRQRDLLTGAVAIEARQTAAASEVAFATGKIDLASLLESSRTVESVELEAIEAEARLGAALAELAHAVGAEDTGDLP